MEYINGITKTLTLTLKTLLLIDGLGAFLTAFLLIAVVKTFNEYENTGLAV